MFSFVPKNKYTQSKRKWEEPLEARVECDEQTGQVYNDKQTKTIEITKDGIYSVTPDTHMLLDKVVVNVEVDKQDIELYVEDLDTTGGDIEITPDAGKVIGKVTIHAGHAPSSGGGNEGGGSGGTEGGTGGTEGGSGGSSGGTEGGTEGGTGGTEGGSGGSSGGTEGSTEGASGGGTEGTGGTDNGTGTTTNP